MEKASFITSLQAWSTLALTIAGLLFAGLQCWLAFKRRKDDLFDRRYAFYLKIRAAWLSTQDESQASADIEDLIPLAEEAGFIFGPDISKHIMSLENARHDGSQFFPNDDFIKPFEKYLRLK